MLLQVVQREGKAHWVLSDPAGCTVIRSERLYPDVEVAKQAGNSVLRSLQRHIEWQRMGESDA